MRNASYRSPALILPLLMAAACSGGGAPTSTGSCKFECLNQLRHLFEQCTSPAGTACQSQASADGSVTNSCFDDGNQLQRTSAALGGVLPTDFTAVYSGGALCVTEEIRILQDGFRTDVFFRDADGNLLAEIDSVGVDGTDPVGNLTCGTVYEFIDPADTSCIPFGRPGYPEFFTDNTTSCVPGTCVPGL